MSGLLAWSPAHDVYTDPSIPFSQVSELFRLREKEICIEAEQRRDLRQRAGRHNRARAVLGDPAERLKKLAVETGYDLRYRVFLRAPLEPWTGPPKSMDLYAALLREEDGSRALPDFSGADLERLQYIRDEELAYVGDDLRVHMLSDASPRDSRQYPGSPLSDFMSKAGRRLASWARELVLRALFHLSVFRQVKRGRRGRYILTGDGGIRPTIAQVCEEANAIKARVAELRGFRFLSASLCGKVIRELIDAGIIEETAPAVHVRQRRSWRTVPRVLKRIGRQDRGVLASLGEVAGAPAPQP